MQDQPSRLDRLILFLEESPKDTFVLFALAKEYEKHGDLENALKYFLQVVEVDSNYVGCYYHLGKLYEKLEQYPTAFKTYIDGMRVAKSQNDEHAFSELAGAKLELGDDEDFE